MAFRTCEQCQAWFDGRSDARFCSVGCRVAAFRAAKALQPAVEAVTPRRRLSDDEVLDRQLRWYLKRAYEREDDE